MIVLANKQLFAKVLEAQLMLHYMSKLLPDSGYVYEALIDPAMLKHFIKPDPEKSNSKPLIKSASLA
jgi:hypothetical protein